MVAGPDPRRHGIPELDRVSDVLDSATVEIAGRLQRERTLVADVSHQLRSRLTAVRLRLDELSGYPDPAVVDEAEAAMAQVDRLTTAIDELVRAARDDHSTAAAVTVVSELDAVVAEKLMTAIDKFSAPQPQPDGSRDPRVVAPMHSRSFSTSPPTARLPTHRRTLTATT